MGRKRGIQRWASRLARLLKLRRPISSHQNLDGVAIGDQLALSSAQARDSHSAGYLNTISTHLHRQYQQTGNLQDLEAAITNAYLSVARTPDKNPNRAGRLNNLANTLHSRYERTGNVQDLEAAIANSMLAVADTADIDPNGAVYLNSLSHALSSRYSRTGNLQDLEAAITNARLAVATTPDDVPDHACYLDSLSIRLASLYKRTGSLQDLDAAIDSTKLALAITPGDLPDRAGWLSNLSNHLSDRYRRLGYLQDLESAIENVSLAVAATPDNHPDRPIYLNTLSHHLFTRYQRTGNLNDLEASITNANQAVAATPADHVDRAAYLHNLSLRLSSRYEKTRNLHELEAAINNANLALAACSDSHPEHAAILTSLSNRFSERYERTENLQDLEAAITNANSAVVTTPRDDPGYARYLSNLARHLHTRYTRTENLQDLKTAIEYSITSANLPNTVPRHRIVYSRRAIQMLHRQHRWNDASILAEDAVHLLPLVCSRSLTRDDQQHAITLTAGLAADACSVFLQLGQPEKALQILEFGRGLILGYLIDSRSDINQLHKDHPELAKTYDRLRSILSQDRTSVPLESRDQLLQWKHRASLELEDCLSAIRQQEGYKHFLLEPAAQDLTSQATKGPIIIVNITDFGSHAIIVQDEEIRSIPLSDLLQTSRFALDIKVQQFRSARENDHDSRDIEGELDPLGSIQHLSTTYYDATSLQWLWSSCVKPILSELRPSLSSPGNLPRIWWIGTGVASSLPFHAAGDDGRSTENTMSHAISSYTPSIKALAYSRSCLEKLAPRNGTTSIYIAAMPTTPNERPLPGVEPEINVIQQAAKNAYTVHVHKYPTPEAVLNAMEDTDIIHFACHGSSDLRNPSGSHLLLHHGSLLTTAVGKLTVQQISNHVFGRARIAYLSACSTAQVTTRELADEAIHLASAFQVAGFGHVIASLWSVDDAICAQLAGGFYSYLVEHQTGTLSDRLIAEALHKAVLQVRRHENASVWASFIHYGA